MKKITITRKIEILLEGYEKEEFKKTFDTIYRWRQICFKAANLIASHHFIQGQIKEFFYLTENTKIKLANSEKDEAGILMTSNENTTYQVLSKNFKGQIPMAILSSLNRTIVQTFKQEKKNYFTGIKSLRNYKESIPIPIVADHIVNIKENEFANFTFTLYGINFRTNFGRDLSGNRIIFDQSLKGGYELCNSSIQIEKKNGKTKLFLLAVFQFDKLRIEIDSDKIATARLSFDTPIVFSVGEHEQKIGSKEEFLHRRTAIQAGLRRAQISSKFNKGGHGIQAKIAAIDRYKSAEKSYVSSRVHKYSAELIKLCLRFKCGKLRLYTDILPEEIKKEEFLLRNWNYYGLTEKIKYKCAKYGIELVL